MSKVHPEGEASETHTVRTGGRRPEPPGRAEGSRAARESAPDAWRVFCPVYGDLPAESGKPGTRTAPAAALAQSSRGRAPRAGCRRGPRRRCPLSPAGTAEASSGAGPKSPPMSLPLTRLQLRPGLHTQAPTRVTGASGGSCHDR